MARVSVVTIAESPADAASASVDAELDRLHDGGGVHTIVPPGPLPTLQDPAPWVLVHDGNAVLTRGSIERLLAAGEAGDATDAVYADFEVGEDGRALRAFVPAFAPEWLRHVDVCGPVLLLRADLYAAVAAIGPVVAGVELHDLALRVAERTDRVVRVTDVGSRRPARAIEHDAVAAVTARHCERAGIDAAIERGPVPGTVRVRRRLTGRPLVSVIIPTRGTRGTVFGTERCFVVEAVRSLVERSTYRELEYVVVADTGTPAGVLDELRALGGDALDVVDFDEPFNFPAKIDRGIARARGELLLLLNDDTELIDRDGVAELVAQLGEGGVAMVGAKLLFEDGRLQHGGHVYTGAIHHLCFGEAGDSPGPAPLFPLAVARECSGVTAGCALVRRSAYTSVGGLDHDLPHNYNDVDLSLKLRAAGHRIVWTPWSTWFHFESRTRQPDIRPDELDAIDRRWHDRLRDDPYHHPALPTDNGDRRPAPSAPSPPTFAQKLRHRVGRMIPGRRLRRPHGVNLVGYLSATSGLGERARELESVLRAAGIRYSAWDLGVTESARADRTHTANPDDGTIFDTTVAVVTALAFPGLDAAFHALVREVDRVVGYWFWELATVPPDHRPAIEMVDEIWTPTRFVRDAYAAATQVPVVLVPLPITEPTPSPLTRADFGFGDEVVFLCSFDHLSAMERKQPIAVVEAFRHAFPETDPESGIQVRLVVKSINGHLRPDAVARLAEATGGDARIDIRDEYLDDGDQAALLRAADVYVSLHRSEGLGLHIAEAMWLGTAIVATDYSGSTDLIDAEVAEVVPFRLVPVEEGGEAYHTGEWADPDVAAAADAMRRLATDLEHRSALVGRARRRVELQADPADAVARIGGLLAPSRRRRRGPGAPLA